MINQQLAGGICLFTPLFALFQLFSLHVSVCCVYMLTCTACAAYMHSLYISHHVICDVSHATLPV